MVRAAAVQLVARDHSEAPLALCEALYSIKQAAENGAELIVLPECTWPGYLLGPQTTKVWDRLSRYQEVVVKFSKSAKEFGAVIVVGLAIPSSSQGGRASNVAAVFESDGTHRFAQKQVLWDIERSWFSPASSSQVFGTSVGRLGILICADARLPEIAREVAVQGAEILVSPTAWVTYDEHPNALTNTIADFMLPSRAKENGLWTVAASKVGMEQQLIAYCGKSCIVDPTGVVVSRASSSEATILYHDIFPAPAVFPVMRHSERYRLLVEPTNELPVVKQQEGSQEGVACALRVAISTLSTAPSQDQMELLRAAEASILVSQNPMNVEFDGVRIGPLDSEIVAINVLGRVLGQWSETHSDAGGVETLGEVLQTPGGNVGVLVGVDGLVPELARELMLKGADIILWFLAPPDAFDVARTRAVENRVYITLLSTTGSQDSAVVMGPDGRSVAESHGSKRLILATVSLLESRRKGIDPGTDVVAIRRPETYHALVDFDSPG